MKNRVIVKKLIFSAQSDITFSKGENLLKTALLKLMEDQITDVAEFGKDLVKLYPDELNPYDSQGDYYLAVEKHSKAYESFMMAVDIDPTWTGSLRRIKKSKCHDHFT